MIVTVSRELLVKTMKRMKPLSARAQGDKTAYKDALTLAAVGSELMISAGPGTSFMAVYLPAEVQEEGSCNISYQLLELAKAAPDEELTLSANKRLDMRGNSGFKAHLAQNSIALPYEAMSNHVQAGSDGDVVLRTDELLNLIDISEAFPPYPLGVANLQWIEIIQSESCLMAAIQPNEIGGLDSFPLVGESSGNDRRFVLRTDLLKPVLTFAGEYTKLGELKSASGAIMVSDPDNNSWWGLVLQTVYNNAE